MKKEVEEKKKISCGLIMPISAIDGYKTEHWTEVKSILSDSIKSIDKYEIVVNMVSDADDSGVIQKRIVQNIYDSDIVVCDVSAKNPNVMFELGMRLAFDKPTIIVKDNLTGYSFDTGVIEHVDYPADLRFQQIVEFKKRLANKVLATYENAINNSDHSTFLKNFGKFTVAKLEENAIPAEKMIIEMLSEIQIGMSKFRNDAQHKMDGRLYHNKNNYYRNYYYPEDLDVSKEIVKFYMKINNINSLEELRNKDEDFRNYIKNEMDIRNKEYDETNFKIYYNIASMFI